jgi:ligand-binding sensor domain-containing protein
MNRYLKYFLWLTLCINKAFPQLLPFKHYRSKDGLISDKVTAVIRDQKGLLWVGTDFGINWHDGTRFIKPGLHVRKQTNETSLRV